MIASIANHLWQSTAFVLAAGLLTIVLRRNCARVRYWVWLCASVKFLLPFSLLIGLGNLLPVQTAPIQRSVTFTTVKIAEPFSQPLPPLAPARNSRDWLRIATDGIWSCGFAILVILRIRGWFRVRAAVRAGVPAGLVSNVEVRSSPRLLEPGVVGLFRPILLLPEGIAERLTPAQFEAVLAHELSHVRRRDNLTGAVQMVVEAAFWFHPLVWWIGARLIEERERACDEAVLDLGNQPRDYADAILGVVKLYVESPIVCVAGVTGSNLKKRIEAIMNTRTVFGLNFAKKTLLAIAGVAAIAIPIGVGMLTIPKLVAQAPAEPQPQTAQPAQAPSPVPAPTVTAGALASPAASAAPAKATMVYQGKNKTFFFFQRPVRFADTSSSPSTDSPTMKDIRTHYGPPDYIEQRESDTAPPSQIWRYNYLADFQGRAEFEFMGPKGGLRVNWPPPLATFEGKPAIAQGLADQLAGGVAQTPIAGLLGAHAEMQTYPSSVPQRLVVPFVPSVGTFDVAAEIRSADGASVANLRDHIVLAPKPEGTPLGRYQASFTLVPGSYTCNVALRDPSGQIYTETISFEMK